MLMLATETGPMKKTYTKPILLRQGVLSRVTAVSVDVRSDRRLKTNISRIGTTVFGLPLYRFSYRGSDDMFTGVMAQDVLGVMPQAVSRDAAGFYRVNYGMLGIEMQRAA
jgi:hypothetical protein